MGANNSSVQNEATSSGVFAHSAVFAHSHNVASVRHFNASLLECCDSGKIYCQSSIISHIFYCDKSEVKNEIEVDCLTAETPLLLLDQDAGIY